MSSNLTIDEEPSIEEINNTMRCIADRFPSPNGESPLRKTRSQILENLASLEEKLRQNGRVLGPWAQAYRDGDSLKAAKLFHLEYTANMRRKRTREALGLNPDGQKRNDVNSPRSVPVVSEEATSTTKDEEVVDGDQDEPTAMRRRTSEPSCSCSRGNID